MKKLRFLLVALLVVMYTNAQSSLQVGVLQDAKQATTSDEYGNTPFNPAFIIDAQYQFKQLSSGFVNASIGGEYTDLQNPSNNGVEATKLDFAENDYKRVYVGLGYTFNRLPINNLEANATFNIGLLDRFETSTTLGANFTLSYPLGKGFRFVLASQFVQRKDKTKLYNDDANFTFQKLELDFSGMFGVVYRFGNRINK